MLRVGTMLAVLAAVLGARPAAAQDLTVEDILANHYEALGGLERMQAVTTVRLEGRILLPQGMEATFTQTGMRPNKMRLDFTLQGVTGTQAFDGETAWMLMPFMGQTAPELMPPDMAEPMREQADFDGPLVDYEAKGHRIELVGMEDVEGAPTYELEVTLANGEVTLYYLDAEYFLPIRTETTRTVQGVEAHVIMSLGDYKDVGGLMMPHSMQMTGDASGIQGIVVDTVELDVALDESIFAMPAAAPGGTER